MLVETNKYLAAAFVSCPIWLIFMKNIWVVIWSRALYDYLKNRFANISPMTFTQCATGCRLWWHQNGCNHSTENGPRQSQLPVRMRITFLCILYVTSMVTWSAETDLIAEGRALPLSLIVVSLVRKGMTVGQVRIALPKIREYEMIEQAWVLLNYYEEPSNRCLVQLAWGIYPWKHSNGIS